MKIFHLISSGGVYGAENVVSALVKDLESAGHTALIGLFENRHLPKNDVATQFESRGLRVLRIPCQGRVDLQMIGRIRRLLQIEEIDVLHTHGYKADIYGYFAAKRLGMPLIATCHLWTQQTRMIRFYDSLDKFILRRFDAVVAVAETIAKEAERAGISRDKITTIDNGIDISRFSSAQPTLAQELRKKDELIIGTVGRLVSQKGMEYFLRAGREILTDFPNALFVIVGDGPDRGKLEQLAKDLHIEKSVVFTGSRADMPDVYASFDLFVLASLDEGMPIAVLEAMAAGRPIVATSVGAVPKLIVSRTTGLLVSPMDIGGLARAVSELLTDSELRCALGKNAKSRVRDECSARGMAQKYLEVYSLFLRHRGSPSCVAAV